jgi:hypothetical protein
VSQSDNFELRLGVRGTAQRGPHAGYQVVIDSVGLTPIDPLIVVLSPDLDRANRPDALHLWVNPEDIDDTLRPWHIVWTGPKDNHTAERFI